MIKYLPEGSLINTQENDRYLSDANGMRTAFENGIILEAKVDMCTSTHDLIINLPTIKGIMPRDECAVGIKEGTTKDIAIISRVGKAVCFVISRYENIDGVETAILSRRAAQTKCIDEYLTKLSCGEVIDATVTHIEQFGCFVDIGCGIPSMIPIDETSVSRISSPSDRFAVGQPIKAAFKGYDGEKFYITHKELLGTWMENAERFSQGETVRGIIRSVESYGVFVELTPNLAGLAEPKEGVRPSQTASVYIKSINPEKMKIKLIIVDCYDAPIRLENSYYITEGKIDRWRYSPDNCTKIIETVF